MINTFLEMNRLKAYLRWVKNIMTTTKTSKISVAKTPIVAMVPRFMFPSSPKVTHPSKHDIFDGIK